MHTCPHCQQSGISSLRKILSVALVPATCQLCTKQASIHSIYGLYALGGWIALTWLLIGLSYSSRTSIFLLGTIPALVVMVNHFLLKPPMYAINR